MGDTHFQARLNPNNDAEQAAIEVLQALEEQGWTRREILTEALLTMGDKGIDNFRPPADRAVQTAVERALGGMVGRIVDAIESRIDRLARMTPGDERRGAMRDVARSAVTDSVMNAVDMREWEEE